MRIIPLTLLAALSFHAQAQLWEVADQRNEEVYLSKVLPVGGGRWAVIGRAAWAGSHMISVRNADGTIAWEHEDEYAVEGSGDVVQLPDSGLLHVGLADNCDYYGPESRVRRYAPDGTVLWERTITPLMTYGVTMAAKGSIAHVAVASQDSVYVMDLDGNAVGGFYVPSLDILEILWADDSSLFMATSTDLERVDLAGAVLGSTLFPSIVHDMHWDGQNLFVLANDGVHRFNGNLSPLGQAALPGVDWNSRFLVSDSSLFVNTTSGLYQVADDGSSTLLFTWPALPNLTTTGCAVQNGTVLSVGNTNISGRSTGIIRTLSMSGNAAQHDQDVEVLLQVDSAWTEYLGGWYPWNRRADITGLVVNHGPDTLHSVVLSMWVQVPWILCDQFTNRIDTAGFALPPGDTLSLPFGVVDVAMGMAQSQVENEADEICIVALAPDHLADRNPDDNTACGTYDFTLGITDRMHEAPLTLAPNPAVNTCVLSGVASLGATVHVHIMDLTGRVVAEQSITSSSNNMELDVSALPPATYILSAEGKNSRSMMKLVVARP